MPGTGQNELHAPIRNKLLAALAFIRRAPIGHRLSFNRPYNHMANGARNLFFISKCGNRQLAADNYSAQAVQSQTPQL